MWCNMACATLQFEAPLEIRPKPLLSVLPLAASYAPSNYHCRPAPPHRHPQAPTHARRPPNLQVSMSFQCSRFGSWPLASTTLPPPPTHTHNTNQTHPELDDGKCITDTTHTDHYRDISTAVGDRIVGLPDRNVLCAIVRPPAVDSTLILSPAK